MSTLSSIRSFLFPKIASGAAFEPSAGYERLAVIVLSLEWLIFGSMHFSAPVQTDHQIPDYISFGRQTIAVLTGMLEVTTAMLVLVPRTRRLAAVMSLTLLALFLPAMFKILSDNTALPDIGVPLQTVFRVGLLPNNIYLAILSIYLLNHSPAALVQIPGRPRAARERPAPSGTGLLRVLVAVLLLMANSAGFVVIVAGLPGHFAQGSLWAMMCIASGALIGFLFAVPRVNTTAKSQSYLLPNTNVETVSDWLTKILVGVGLINFSNIGAFLDRLAGELAGSFQSNKDFMLALIIYFFVIGLMQGYLLTRMFLAWEFSSELLAAEQKDAKS